MRDGGFVSSRIFLITSLCCSGERERERERERENERERERMRLVGKSHFHVKFLSLPLLLKPTILALSFSSRQRINSMLIVCGAGLWRAVTRPNEQKKYDLYSLLQYISRYTRPDINFEIALVPYLHILSRLSPLAI